MKVDRKESAIHDNRWMFTILGAYKRRWAPCVQAHEPGQGQLPLDRVWPQGLWFLSRGADRTPLYKADFSDTPEGWRRRSYLIEFGGRAAIQLVGDAADTAGYLAKGRRKAFLSAGVRCENRVAGVPQRIELGFETGDAAG